MHHDETWADFSHQQTAIRRGNRMTIANQLRPGLNLGTFLPVAELVEVEFEVDAFALDHVGRQPVVLSVEAPAAQHLLSFEQPKRGVVKASESTQGSRLPQGFHRPDPG